MKQIDIGKLSENEKKETVKEAKILEVLSHPNIVKFIEVFKTKNGKVAGAILMTTPTESTSNIGHQTSFTHHVSDKHVEYAKKNKGEYEIDPPKEQEKSRGKEYVTPQPIAFNLRPGAAKKSAFAHGGSVGEFDHETMALPEQNYRAQEHNAHRHHEEDGAHQHKHSRLQSNQVVDRAMNLVSNLPRR